MMFNAMSNEIAQMVRLENVIHTIGFIAYLLSMLSLMLNTSYIRFKNVFEYMEIPLLLNGNKNTHTQICFLLLINVN